MSKSISQQEQSFQAQIVQANEKIVTLEKKLCALDDELASHLGQRSQYQLLDEICTSLDKLGKSNAANIFWDGTNVDPEQQKQRLRGVVAGFQQEITAMEQARSILQADIKNERAAAQLLGKQLAELQEIAASRGNEFIVERQARERSFAPTVMPWSSQGEDERRYRKILFPILFITILFGVIVPIIRPPVEKNMGIVVPARIAQIIKKKQEIKQVEQKQKEKVAEKVEEKIAEKTSDKPKPTEADTQRARKIAETKGVLAFKKNFADLMEEPSPQKLGASARISNKADRADSGAPQRSIIVSQATGGSGGINTSAISRQSEGDGGQRIVGAGKNFERVESVATAGSSGADSLSGKAGQPSRTDEEIQIVFDRYKSALYRIYNRELRNNPSLRGKMVLRIVIEPDGRVSACTVKATDLASPALSAEIVDRVLKFNFGPKQGVPALTILYPIDFLPTA